MATVQLRDIVTAGDREAVLALKRAPGQERFLGSMISHFEDAVEDAKASPRMWSVHDGEALKWDETVLRLDLYEETR